MAAVTHRVSTASTSNLNSYVSGSFTPAAGDLLVAFVVTSGTVDTAPTMTDSQGLGFSFYQSTTKAAGDTIYCFVAVKLAAASAMTVTFNCPNDAATGAIIEVASVSGMTRTGTAAIRQFAVQASQASGGTPAPTFTNAALTGNPTLGVVGNATTTAATMTPPTSWTENADTGYGTPTTGAEYVSRDSGFTGTTITWGSTSTTAFGDMIIEMDTSAAPSVNTFTDDFKAAAVNSSLWATSLGGAGTIVEGGGTLTLTNPASSAGTGQNLTAQGHYDMTSAGVLINVRQVGNTGTDEDTNLYVIVGSDFNYRLMFVQEAGTLIAKKVIAGTFTNVASISYNSATMAWWRIRESGGTIFWDYSPDGFTWTNLTSLANPYGITAITPVIEVFENTSTASPGAAIYANFNMVPVPMVSYFQAKPLWLRRFRPTMPQTVPPIGIARTAPQADTTTFSDAIVKSITLNKSDSTTLSDAIVKAISEAKADTTTLSDAIVKALTKNLADSTTLSDAIVKSPAVHEGDTTTLSDAIVKSPVKNLSDTTTLSDAAVKSPALNKADTTTFSDAVAKAFVKNLSDTTTLTDSESDTAAFVRSFGDTTTLTDAISLAVTKALSDSTTLSDLATPTLSNQHDYTAPQADTTALTDVISLEITKNLADSTTLSDAAALHFMKNLADTITLTDARVGVVTLRERDTTHFTDNITFPGLVGVIVYPHLIVLLDGNLVLQLSATAYLPL